MGDLKRGEHMHQSCTACKAKWTTGLEKSE